MKVCSIRFKTSSKSYLFKYDIDLEVGKSVIVETEKGLQYGKVVSFIKDSDISDIVPTSLPQAITKLLEETFI